MQASDLQQKPFEIYFRNVFIISKLSGTLGNSKTSKYEEYTSGNTVYIERVKRRKHTQEWTALRERMLYVKISMNFKNSV
jgi:hypothetical protein